MLETRTVESPKEGELGVSRRTSRTKTRLNDGFKAANAKRSSGACSRHEGIHFGCLRCNPTGEPMKFPF